MPFGPEHYDRLVEPERIEWATEELKKAELEALPDKKLQAALLVADVRLTYGDAATVVGMSERTIASWSKQRPFQQAVALFRRRLHQESLEIGYGEKAARVAVYSDLADRIVEAIRLRAAEADPDLPETATGLFAVEPKTVGYGKDSHIVHLAKFDDAMVKRLMSILEQIAREEGQWVEQSNRTSLDEVQIKFQIKTPHPLPDDAVDAKAVTVTEVKMLPAADAAEMVETRGETQ